MSESEELIIYPVPSLVATLLNRERAKRSPLTEQEVTQIRDACPSVALRPEQVRQIEDRRGYKDIDPENYWEEWQEVQKGLISDESAEPNHALRRTQLERYSCHRGVPWAGSLSLGAFGRRTIFPATMKIEKWMS